MQVYILKYNKNIYQSGYQIIENKKIQFIISTKFAICIFNLKITKNKILKSILNNNKKTHFIFPLV